MLSKGRLLLLTYADAKLRSYAQALCQSANKSGFDGTLLFSPEELAETAFFQKNEATLSQPRGAGYWLWKPYVISKVLEVMFDHDETGWYAKKDCGHVQAQRPRVGGKNKSFGRALENPHMVSG